MLHLLPMPAHLAARSLALGERRQLAGGGNPRCSSDTSRPRRPRAQRRRYVLYRVVPAPLGADQRGCGQHPQASWSGPWTSHPVYVRDLSTGEVRRLMVIGPDTNGPNGGADGPPDDDGSPPPRPPCAAAYRCPSGPWDLATQAVHSAA